jgi:hypothetical protein
MPSATRSWRSTTERRSRPQGRCFSRAEVDTGSSSSARSSSGACSSASRTLSSGSTAGPGPPATGIGRLRRSAAPLDPLERVVNRGKLLPASARTRSAGAEARRRPESRRRRRMQGSDGGVQNRLAAYAELVRPQRREPRMPRPKRGRRRSECRPSDRAVLPRRCIKAFARVAGIARSLPVDCDRPDGVERTLASGR